MDWRSQALRGRGAENPFLDVWFQDARTGYVVGAFGLVLRTADGGKTWEPLGHTTDNPKTLHLYAVRRVGEDLFIAGEQGLLLKLDRTSGRFVAQQIPYQGTLFGLVGNERAVLAHGMRGNVVRSTDGGRSWTSVSTPVQAGLTASTLDERGRIVIVSQAGPCAHEYRRRRELRHDQGGTPDPGRCRGEYRRGRTCLAGPRGVRSMPLA